MKLNSYEKASLDILEALKEDPTIFIINSIYFRLVVGAAQENKLGLYECKTYDLISITDLIPNIFREIELSLPYPTHEDLQITSHFATELVAQYGKSWIPVISNDYKKAKNTSFCDDITMVSWQRYIRANDSIDIKELTVLALDPVQQIRNIAIGKLKTN